jgi:hypothetical protein
MSAAIEAVDRPLTQDGAAEAPATAFGIVLGAEKVVVAAADVAGATELTAEKKPGVGSGWAGAWAKRIAWNAAAVANGSRAASSVPRTALSASSAPGFCRV